MGSPCPPHWTFAARAAYFGDRMCAFCDHRNPAGAKFCNECASPLHLKPCKQCDAINQHAATNCYKCGAAYPALVSTPDAAPVSPATDPTSAPPTPGDVAVAATVAQPLFAASALRAGRRLLRPGKFHLAAIATILMAAAYAAYWINAATPDAMEVASQPIGTREHDAHTAMPAGPIAAQPTPAVPIAAEPTPAVPMAAEPTPAEPERTATLQAPIPAATDPEAPKRASGRQRAVSVSATDRASAQQRPVPERQAPVGATVSVSRSLAAARAGARVAETRKALRPDPWKVMHVSLARCGGDLIARIVCDQRVRLHFCKGHWGKAPECASGVVNEHGQ